MKNLPAYDFMGLKISLFTREELIRYIHNIVASDSKVIAFGYSMGYISLLKKLPRLYEQCNKYDLMVTDGRLFYLFARMFGAPLKFDISIPYLSLLIMELANERGYSVMIIGSTPDTNLKATEAVRKRYPGARVCDGFTGGSFSEKEQLATVQMVNACKPDFLFIGASTPIKEDFASAWKETLNVKMIVPFGGMIDGLAGKVKLTTPLLKKLGLASFVRIAQEPRRLLRKHSRMYFEILFRIMPLTFYHKLILRKKEFNLVDAYLKSKSDHIHKNRS